MGILRSALKTVVKEVAVAAVVYVGKELLVRAVKRIKAHEKVEPQAEAAPVDQLLLENKSAPDAEQKAASASTESEAQAPNVETKPPVAEAITPDVAEPVAKPKVTRRPKVTIEKGPAVAE